MNSFANDPSRAYCFYADAFSEGVTNSGVVFFKMGEMDVCRMLAALACLDEQQVWSRRSYSSDREETEAVWQIFESGTAQPLHGKVI